MNDFEQQIVSALAARRESSRAFNPNLADRSAGINRGISPPIQNRPTNKSSNVMGTTDYGGSLRNPWPDRPRIARSRPSRLEAARALANRPLVMLMAVVFLASGLLNVAQKTDPGVKVVVHTLWPL